MTDTKPTLDEQIAFMSGLNALWKESMKDTSIQDSILKSLEELKRIHESEMPVEPDTVKWIRNTWRDVDFHKPLFNYIDALKAVIQRKDAEAIRKLKCS
jgi:predicted Ser/Thr protein kinase